MRRRDARLACAVGLVLQASCTTAGTGVGDSGVELPTADGAVPPDDAAASEGGVRQVFDPGQEFPLVVNPSGVWRIGYGIDGTLARASFALDEAFVDVGSIHFWHPGQGADRYYPYVAGGASNATTTDATGSWVVRAGELALEGSNTGQHAIVEFVTPEPGAYRVQAEFEGIHVRLSTTDVHVRRGDAALFDALIDGYGGDPTFHPPQGANPRAAYRHTLVLAKDEVLSFAVGYGANGTNDNDTTGLALRIELLGD